MPASRASAFQYVSGNESRSGTMFAAVGNTSGASRLASAATATTTAASATPYAVRRGRRLDHGDEPKTTSANRYARTRSNSRIARPGACDHRSDRSDQAAKSASAPVENASGRLQPAKGRVTITTRRARSTRSPAHVTPTASAKYPPALNDV